MFSWTARRGEAPPHIEAAKPQPNSHLRPAFPQRPRSRNVRQGFSRNEL